MLLGGSATIEDLTGVDKKIAAFLVPIFSCWIYTVYGGLRATFFASYAGCISRPAHNLGGYFPDFPK